MITVQKKSKDFVSIIDHKKSFLQIQTFGNHTGLGAHLLVHRLINQGKLMTGIFHCENFVVFRAFAGVKLKLEAALCFAYTWANNQVCVRAQ